eukprot:TRINITY_DN1539_c0_g1_i5.p1 TRINITY_DN1539_c0_g1~~TRINITY_DN1539_c0_g1_i5.p1  ORF type:complete len:801 (-),score=224.25 TRINITY_DN1539_c0_g1_i5:72-2474(-)
MRVLVSRLDGPYGKELPGILHRAGHTVVGTAAMGWPKQPRFVEEIKYTSSYMGTAGEPIHECEDMDDEELKHWIRGCDGYVTDIFTDVIEARAIIQHVARARPNEEEGEEKKQYVALSNISTWANTRREVDPEAPPVEQGEVSLPEPFKADDRGKDTEDEPGLRVPHPRFKREAGFEQLLCNTEWFNVEPIVICTGVVYGDGEDWLHPTFQKIWLTGRVEEQALASTNRVPMVHRADVLTAVGECFGENKPGENYLLAVDESSATWGEVAAAMRSKLSVLSLEESPAPPNEAEEFAELMEEAEHHGYPEYMLYKSDLLFDSEPFAALVGEDAEDEPPRWRARKGIVAAMDTVVAEYKTSRMLGPKRIFIDTADVDIPSEAVTALGDRLAARFQVPHVTIAYALAEARHGPKKLVSDVRNAISGKKKSPLLEPAAGEEVEGDASGESEVRSSAEESGEETEASTDGARAEVPEARGRTTPVPDAAAAPLVKSLVDDIQAFENTRHVVLEPDYLKISTTNKKLLDRVFRHVLSSHECKSHGFVLSGYPKTLAEAEQLFRDEPPAKPQPVEGEEEQPEDEAAPDPKLGKDGKIDGEFLPQFTIVIEGPAARGSLLPAGAAFVAASDASKERFQSLLRVDARELEAGNTKEYCTERVIQALGLPLHFDKDSAEEELLHRQTELQELAQVIRHNEEQQKRESEEASGNSPTKQRAALENRQEALMSAVEEELLANVDPKDMAARDYALKYAMPALHKGMCMTGRLRPQDPVDFVSAFMLEYEGEDTDYLEPGKLNLPKFGAKKIK